MNISSATKNGQVKANLNSIQAPSARFTAMKSTSVIPFCKRPTPSILLIKPERRIPVSFYSIMLKITTKPLFQKIYMQVQEELVYRRVFKTIVNGKKHNYSYTHCFSNIIICSNYDEIFRRIHWDNHGYKSIVWRCISRLKVTGLECHARTINELDLQEIVLIALNERFSYKSKYNHIRTLHPSL